MHRGCIQNRNLRFHGMGQEIGTIPRLALGSFRPVDRQLNYLKVNDLW
jgi:hypothetical protein